MQCSVTQREPSQEAGTSWYFQAGEKNPLNTFKNSISAGVFCRVPLDLWEFRGLGWVWFVLNGVSQCLSFNAFLI